MWRLFFIVFLLFTSSRATAQNKNESRLIEKGKYVIYGFGKTGAGFSRSTDNLMLEGNFAAAATLNQTYFAGIFTGVNINTLPHPITYDILIGPNGENSITTTNDGAVRLNYTGFYAGYWYQSNFPFHAGASLRIGRGKSTVFDPFGVELSEDNISIFQPQLEGFYKFNGWCKFSVSLGYRWIYGYDGVPEHNLSSNHHNSPTLELSFLFGWFNLKRYE